MRYREIKPAPILARFIECFWTLERETTTEQSEPERILPDGCVELILNFGVPFRELREDGQEEIQPQLFLVGQMTRPMLIVANGRVELIGIRFHPGGTLPFFKLPMNELTNHVVEIEDLSRNLEAELSNQLGECPSLKAKLTCLQRLLMLWVAGKDDSPVRILASKIVARGGQVKLDEIAFDAGISNRQLERRFLRDIGVGPKLLCRILRFQQVFRAVEKNDGGWADVAADCGYYDQPHLIRDFQQFAGRAPALLLAHASPLMRSFTRIDRMSHFSNTATIGLD